MPEPFDRDHLLAQVVMRLVTLRLAGVMRAPCDFGDFFGGQAGGDARLLWDWSRLISDVNHLFDEVLEPALVDPGRRHRRVPVEAVGRPRGVVRWSATARRHLQRPTVGPLRYQCAVAERSLFAPENLLLVRTIDELSRRSAGVSTRLEASRLLRTDERELLRRQRERVARASQVPWVAQCSERLLVERLHDRASDLELERAVRERVRGRPCIAPGWARDLLALRESSPRLPDPASIEGLAGEGLWRQLCGLEMLSLLRSNLSLRQRVNGRGFVSPDGASFCPVDEGPAWWVTGPTLETIGVLCSSATGWTDVRRDALYWSWTVKQGPADVDRWVILHTAEDGPDEHPRSRRGIELQYWRVRPDRVPSERLERVLADWTGRTTESGDPSLSRVPARRSGRRAADA